MPFSKSENLVMLGMSGDLAKAITKAKPQVASLVSIVSANATDLPTAQTLANETKTVVNALIAALKAQG